MSRSINPYLNTQTLLNPLSESISLIIKESISPISESINLMIEESTASIRACIDKLISDIDIINAEMSTNIQNSVSMITSSALQDLKIITSTTWDNYPTYNCDELYESVDIVSDIIETIDSYDYQYFNDYKSDLELAKKSLLFSESKEINYQQWITTICAILTLVLAFATYLKPSKYEEESLKVLNSINSNLQQLVESQE